MAFSSTRLAYGFNRYKDFKPQGLSRCFVDELLMRRLRRNHRTSIQGKIVVFPRNLCRTGDLLNIKCLCNKCTSWVLSVDIMLLLITTRTRAPELMMQGLHVAGKLTRACIQSDNRVI